MKQVKDTVGLISKTIDTARTAQSSATQSSKSWLATKLDNIKSEYHRIRNELKDLKKTNFNLGLEHYNKGNAGDARTRFKMLKYFAKDIKVLDYYIGRTYFEEGDNKNAIKYLQNYRASGDTQFADETTYTLHKMNGEFDKIKDVPLSLVAHYYDLVSDIYNEAFIDDKANSPQKIVFEMVNRALIDITAPYGHVVLDVGCGTGYIGTLLKSTKVATVVDGVDISPKMIEKSKSHKVDNLPVYNDLQLCNAIDYLKKTDKEYSIVIASNFIGHYTKPEEFLNLAHAKLKTTGLLAFTFKVNPSDEKISFNKNSEDFHYNGKYIMSLIMNDNWTLLKSMPISFMEEGDTGLIILQKK